MKTLLLHGQTPADLTTAADLLRAGECVAVPTETVYGLAADARNAKAVNGIFAAKGRPANHPLIVHLADARQLDDWATDIATEARRLADAFWPGPLTLLLAKRDDVPAEVTGGLATIGLRVPAHPVLQQLLQQLNTGVAAPSANPYKALSPTTAEQVVAGLDGRIAAVVDGGACDFGLESTIVDVTDPAAGIRILRAGPIGRIDLEQVLGCPVEAPQEHQVAVSGNVKAHYQPRTPLTLLSGDQLLQHCGGGVPEGVQCLVWSQRLRRELPQDDFVTSLADTPQAFAQQLYRTLFQCDQLGRQQLWLELPPQTEDWLAVNDRLRRAAY